jgi:hypothetical protein
LESSGRQRLVGLGEQVWNDSAFFINSPCFPDILLSVWEVETIGSANSVWNCVSIPKPHPSSVPSRSDFSSSRLVLPLAESFIVLTASAASSYHSVLSFQVRLGSSHAVPSAPHLSLKSALLMLATTPFASKLS